MTSRTQLQPILGDPKKLTLPVWAVIAIETGDISGLSGDAICAIEALEMELTTQFPEGHHIDCPLDIDADKRFAPTNDMNSIGTDVIDVFVYPRIDSRKTSPAKSARSAMLADISQYISPVDSAHIIAIDASGARENEHGPIIRVYLGEAIIWENPALKS